MGVCASCLSGVPAAVAGAKRDELCAILVKSTELPRALWPALLVGGLPANGAGS